MIQYSIESKDRRSHRNIAETNEVCISATQNVNKKAVLLHLVPDLVSVMWKDHYDERWRSLESGEDLSASTAEVLFRGILSRKSQRKACGTYICNVSLGIFALNKGSSIRNVDSNTPAGA